MRRAVGFALCASFLKSRIFEAVNNKRPLWKRILIALGAIVGVLALAIGALAYTMFANLAPVVDGKELVPGIRIVKDGYVTIGVIDNGDGHVALVDCGNDKTGKAILADLASHGESQSSVRMILITHGHPDHTAGCALFPQAAIASLRTEVDLVEGKVGAHGPITQLFPAKLTGLKVTNALADDERVVIGKRTAHVFAVPGHTAGSAAYLVDGVLFLGDSGGVTKAGELVGAPWPVTDDLPLNKASLHALGTRLRAGDDPLRVIAPAHTGVSSKPGLADDLIAVP